MKHGNLLRSALLSACQVTLIALAIGFLHCIMPSTAGAQNQPTGATCSTNSQCQSGACKNGICMPPPNTGANTGARCSTNSQCPSGVCQNGICMPPPNTGAQAQAVTNLNNALNSARAKIAAWSTYATAVQNATNACKNVPAASFAAGTPPQCNVPSPPN